MKNPRSNIVLSKLTSFLLFLVLPIFVSAALVTVDPQVDFPVPISKSQLNASSIKSKQIAPPYHPKSYNTTDYSAALFLTPAKTEQVQQKTKLYDLKTQGKKLLNDYQDNELLFESLKTLSQAKQLWSDADSLTTDFAHDIIFSLKLDTLIHSEISATPTLQNHKTGFNTQNTNVVNYKLYNTNQDGSENAAVQASDEISIFLSGLLHINTLYYLAAILILLSFLQWLIPFILRLFP
jgi:hypothetical protein